MQLKSGILHTPVAKILDLDGFESFLERKNVRLGVNGNPACIAIPIKRGILNLN